MRRLATNESLSCLPIYIYYFFVVAKLYAICMAEPHMSNLFRIIIMILCTKGLILKMFDLLYIVSACEVKRLMANTMISSDLRLSRM
jgi:hypothetical protein